MDILTGQLKNLILPVAVVLISGENKMLAFTLLTPFLLDVMIFVLKRLYDYYLEYKTDENTFCISSKTLAEKDNRFYYFVMEKIKNKCIEGKHFNGLNDRCIYDIEYIMKYSRKINGTKIKGFTKLMKLNIPKKIEMYMYPSLKIGLSSTVKKEKFRFSKEPTEMDVINFYHKDCCTLNSFEQMLIEDYEKHIRELIGKKNSGKVKCFHYSSSSDRKKWKKVSLNVNKTFKNTILDTGIADQIRNIIKKFDNGEQEHDRTGQPYKLGFLFHGSPGTGKTSSVFAISNEYKKNIYYADEDLIYDDFPIDVMEDIKPGSLLVFEDVDLLIQNFMNKRNIKKKENKTVTVECNSNQPEEEKKNDNKDVVEGLFSTIIKGHKNKLLRKFLSVMDGYFSLKGVIVIFTTNDPSGFDDALLRSGRIDQKCEFDYCTKDQAKDIYKLFRIEFDPTSFKKNTTSADVIKEILKK